MTSTRNGGAGHEDLRETVTGGLAALTASKANEVERNQSIVLWILDTYF
jgi:hypothetical protein